MQPKGIVTRPFLICPRYIFKIEIYSAIQLIRPSRIYRCRYRVGQHGRAESALVLVPRLVLEQVKYIQFRVMVFERREQRLDDDLLARQFRSARKNTAVVILRIHILVKAPTAFADNTGR